MSNYPHYTPESKFIPQHQPPNQTSLILGIFSIITGVIGVFPGCCCLLIWAPMALIAIGTGIGGILSAEPHDPTGKTLSIVGVALGGGVLLLHMLYFILVMIDAVAPHNFQQFQNNF